MCVPWRITGSRPWALMVLCGIVTVFFVIEFAQPRHSDVSHRTAGTWIVNLAWGATLVRIWFGFMTRLAGAGGGWERPMLLIVFFLSFVFTGAGSFSVDLDLRSRGALPGWMRRISITRSTDEAFAAASAK